MDVLGLSSFNLVRQLLTPGKRKSHPISDED